MHKTSVTARKKQKNKQNINAVKWIYIKNNDKNTIYMYQVNEEAFRKNKRYK